jgi:hypothetical protein
LQTRTSRRGHRKFHRCSSSLDEAIGSFTDALQALKRSSEVSQTLLKL